MSFVIPLWCQLPTGEVTDVDNLFQSSMKDGRDGDATWLVAMDKAEKCYNHLLNVVGWKPEQARSVLPNSLKTEIVMTANLREWRHFFKLRTSTAAHPQMREIAQPLLDELRTKIPVIFDNIETK